MLEVLIFWISFGHYKNFEHNMQRVFMHVSQKTDQNKTKTHNCFQFGTKIKRTKTGIKTNTYKFQLKTKTKRE